MLGEFFIILLHLYHNDGKYRVVESDSFTQYLHYGENSNVYGVQYNNGRI